jgi:hypothetical protein
MYTPTDRVSEEQWRSEIGAAVLSQQIECMPGSYRGRIMHQRRNSNSAFGEKGFPFKGPPQPTTAERTCCNASNPELLQRAHADSLTLVVSNAKLCFQTTLALQSELGKES